MDTDQLVLFAPYLPLVITTVYVGIHWSRFENELREFSRFIFLSALIQIPSLILYIFGINNMPLLHLYTLLGGIVLIRFYRKSFNSYLPKNVLDVLVLIYMIFNIINSSFFEGILTFNSNSLVLQASLMICLSLSYFNFALLKTGWNQQQAKSRLWINSGVFLYFTSNLILYYLGDHLMKTIFKGSIFREVWMWHSLIISIMYVFFLFGFMSVPKKSDA